MVARLHTPVLMTALQVLIQTDLQFQLPGLNKSSCHWERVLSHLALLVFIGTLKDYFKSTLISTSTLLFSFLNAFIFFHWNYSLLIWAIIFPTGHSILTFEKLIMITSFFLLSFSKPFHFYATSSLYFNLDPLDLELTSAAWIINQWFSLK